MIPLTDGVEVLRECCEFEDVSHLVDALVKVCVAAFHSCAAGVDTSLRIHQLNCILAKKKKRLQNGQCVRTATLISFALAKIKE
jgi:hypothetical protein